MAVAVAVVVAVVVAVADVSSGVASRAGFVFADDAVAVGRDG
ncbi:hypothetical protein ACFWVC_27045 [Streptomyces sp. NPDC058691]